MFGMIFSKVFGTKGVDDESEDDGTCVVPQ